MIPTALPGGVSTSGSGGLSAPITNASLATMANKTFKGRHSSGTGAPEDVTAAQLLADLAVPAAPADGMFGTGADGALVNAGTTTLARNMHYTNVSGTGTIDCAGFIVFIRGTLTGSVTFSNSAVGAAGATSGLVFGGTAGGAAVVATSNAGTNLTLNRSIGANGGAGGAGFSGAGGAGGTASKVTAAFIGVTISDPTKFDPLWLRTGRVLGTAANPLSVGGGAGGGSGAGDGANLSGPGGGGGGVCLVFARDASGFTGTIAANGANGGDGAGGNVGGGGGGGGGAAFLITAVIPTGAYTLTAAAGSGGAKVGTGVAGSSGTTGLTATLAVA